MRARPGLWTLLLWLVIACNDTSPGVPCVSDRECALPTVCIEGACVVECRRDRECDPGELCIENECRSPDRCAIDLDCAPFGQVCDRLSFRCVQGNGPAPDTGPPFLDATVRPRVDAGPEPRVDAAPPPPPSADASPPTLPPASDAGPVDAVPPGPDARPRGNRAYGETCGCPGDCASGFCVENKLRATRTCTERCENDDACPGIDTCVQAQVRGGGSAECPPVDLGLEPGTIVGVCAPNETSLPCDGPQGCTSGICLTPPRPAQWLVPQNICTMRCESDGKCPSGYTCQSIQANGGRISVCNLDLGPVYQCTDVLQCGGTCRVPAGRDEVEVTRCAQLEAGGSGYCTCSCGSAADCPQGYACQRALESGDGSRPGICTPLAGFVCPREAVAPIQDPPFECASLQCMGGDPDNPRYSRCTSQCNDARDCPAGYACEPFDGLSYCVPR